MSQGSDAAPRMTIVIPTLNRAALVGRALESALAQDSADLEIIVSDNGSRDETRAVLARYSDPRLRILHHEETIPAVDHANFLLREARGKFFLGLSDDDWIEPDFVEKVLALFDRKPGLSFVWTGCWIHYADVALPARTGPEVEGGANFLAAFLAGERNVCWCACVTRTADLRRIGSLPPDVICGDMFYWTKLATFGDVGCVPEPISNYVVYRDAGDGDAGGRSVLSWAEDTARWVRDIMASCEKTGTRYYSRDELRGYADRFLARSVANQFVWQAMRGVDRASLFRSVKPALPYLRGHDRSPWIRVIASLLAPRRLLRSRMLAEARRRARESRKNGDLGPIAGSPHP